MPILNLYVLGAWLSLSCVSGLHLKGGSLVQSSSTAESKRRAWPMVEQFVAKQKLEGKVVRVLQIGASDGDLKTLVAGGRDGNGRDPVLSVLLQPHVQGYLIEPNPPEYEKLRKNLKILLKDSEENEEEEEEEENEERKRLRSTRKNKNNVFNGAFKNRVHTYNAAVCAEQTVDGTVPFYVVKEVYGWHYPNSPHWKLHELSSMNKSHVMQYLGDAEFPLSDSEKENYVAELTVDCLTPKSLLGRIGLEANMIDVLSIDTEGFDGMIMEAFLKKLDSGFSPSVIIFEAVHIKDQKQLLRVTEELRRRNYQLTIGHDVVAWKKEICEYSHLRECGNQQ